MLAVKPDAPLLASSQNLKWVLATAEDMLDWQCQEGRKIASSQTPGNSVARRSHQRHLELAEMPNQQVKAT